MQKEPLETRLHRLEWRLNLLIGIVLIQIGLTLILLVQSFLPSTATLVFISVLLVILVVIFHKQIPGWFGNISRYVFAQLLSAQKPGTYKDVK